MSMNTLEYSLFNNASVKRTIRFSLFTIILLVVGIPITYLGASVAYDKYRHHEFLDMFFKNCAKQLPMIIDNVQYLCTIEKVG